MKQQFSALLTKEMDRREFLKYSGGIILAAIGITGMAKLLLTQAGVDTHITARAKDFAGYGSSPYGR